MPHVSLLVGVRKECPPGQRKPDILCLGIVEVLFRTDPGQPLITAGEDRAIPLRGEKGQPTALPSQR